MNKTSVLVCDEQRTEHGAFHFRRKRLGAAAFHYHLADEEALFVLEGEGVLRYAGEEQPLRAGDSIAFPPGPPGHQVINRSDAPLRYLALSTMIEPEVAVYPDSKKVGVLARSQGLASVHRQEAAVDYYEGEE